MTFRICKTFAISSFNSWYFSTFSSCLSFTLSSPGMTTFIIMISSLSFLSIKTKSGLLASIFRSHWTLKSHSILKFSLSTTLSGFCSYQLLALSNPHLPQSCQLIYRATLSCLSLCSICASLLHSLTTWATVSPLLPHILHKGDSAVWSIWNLITCSQSLFLGATYQGPSWVHPFKSPFCSSLPGSILINAFLSSHILPMHSFLLPFILRLLCFLHFVLLWVLLLLPPQGFGPDGQNPRRHPRGSRVLGGKFHSTRKISIFQEQGSQGIAEKFARDCRNFVGGRRNTRRSLRAVSLHEILKWKGKSWN